MHMALGSLRVSSAWLSFRKYKSSGSRLAAPTEKLTYHVHSMYPIDMENIRTFQLFKWKDMPCAFLPVDPATNTPWYTPGPELDSFRLSSKSHWDIPVTIGNEQVHVLASHPTPPVFE